jgi:hypothetical protein
VLDAWAGVLWCCRTVSFVGSTVYMHAALQRCAVLTSCWGGVVIAHLALHGVAFCCCMLVCWHGGQVRWQVGCTLLFVRGVPCWCFCTCAVLQEVSRYCTLLHKAWWDTKHFCGGACGQRMVWGVLCTAPVCGTASDRHLCRKAAAAAGGKQGVVVAGGGVRMCRLLNTG